MYSVCLKGTENTPANIKHHILFLNIRDFAVCNKNINRSVLQKVSFEVVGVYTALLMLVFLSSVSFYSFSKRPLHAILGGCPLLFSDLSVWPDESEVYILWPACNLAH